MSSSTRLFITVAAACGIGTAGALAGWHYFQQWSAARAKAQAEADAAAFAKSPQGLQRAAVAQRLYVPDSAEFRNERTAKGEPGVWCGEVRASNRMGTKLSWARYVVTPSSSKKEPAGTLNVDIDFAASKGNGDDPSPVFLVMWNNYCT